MQAEPQAWDPICRVEVNLVCDVLAVMARHELDNGSLGIVRVMKNNSPLIWGRIPRRTLLNPSCHRRP